MGLLVMKLRPARNTSDSTYQKKEIHQILRDHMKFLGQVVKVFFHLGGESISFSDIA
jgi:hypothetical protein